MSLINDALKKARESQPADLNATADGPPLRPVDAVRSSGRREFSFNLLLLLLAGVVLLLAGLFIAEWYQESRVNVRVRAKAKPWETPDITIIKPPPVVHEPKNTLPTMTAPVPAIPQTVALVSGLSNAIAESPAKQETKYKLQSVFYRPVGASAVINGKTVSVGERAQGALVIAIGKESATIVTPSGQTNFLELP